MAEPVPPETEDCNNNGIPTDDLIAAAGKSSSITVDGQTVTRRSISELIELDKHLNSKQAACRAAGGWASIKMAKMQPPGTTGS